jgi:zinc metalloprotease ZmpB
MADTNILYDEQGHPRHFNFVEDADEAQAAASASRARPATAQEAAKQFLASHADLLQLKQNVMQSMDVRASLAPVAENEALRFESEKHTMDSTVVSYNQTMFGLPIYQAGVSVVMHGPQNQIKAATSTLHYDVAAQPPGHSLTNMSALDTAASGAHDNVVRKAIPAAQGMRINRTRLMVYQYDPANRVHHDHGDPGFGAQPPSLPLPPVPASIKPGTHYVVVEALFSYPLPNWGTLNWQAFVEPESGAVLYLRALVDGVTGLVFDRDPITKTGNLANLPTASNAILDPLRDPVQLVDLGPPAAGHQNLSGTFVQIANVDPPTPAIPTTIAPFNFAFDARTDDFAAVNAYYHCDRFFRTVRDIGFNIPSYFDGTAFPVPVDHHALGNVINAQCRGNTLSNGIGSVVFSLADLSNPPLGIAADWRVVLHELGGHGILWDHVDSPNFGFSHSAGDSIAVILNDPETQAPDRFVSFPWVNIGRRHDRPVAGGWGWGGANDLNGYFSEQILATTHFRLYRSIGGDSASLARRQFAATSAVYLILRGVSQLTPATNPPNALAWEQQLEWADAGVWTRTNPAQTHAGGAYHKVIRWAFEKQGLFRPGPPATVEGAPPPVDVYIDDGRHGEYPFQPNHWSCTDIWNRVGVGAGGGVHQEPIVGQTNYAYVRIKNRGTTPATKVVVKGFHALPGVGLVYPTDWTPMATPQLTAPNLAAHDAVGVVVGPFKWVPSQVGHECMFFSVSAKGDASNIDGAITGPIPEWRLVPHDNNIAQRNVHPVFPQLVKVDWKKLPFWIRNHGRLPVRLGLTVKVPNWLGRLGWKFSVPQITKDRAVLKPDQLLKVNVAMTKGKPYNTAVLAKQADHDIVFTVLQDGMPVGGMTYRLSADAKQGLAAPAKVKTRTVARSANARRAVKSKSVASRSRSKKTR